VNGLVSEAAPVTADEGGAAGTETTAAGEEAAETVAGSAELSAVPDAGVVQILLQRHRAMSQGCWVERHQEQVCRPWPGKNPWVYCPLTEGNITGLVAAELGEIGARKLTVEQAIKLLVFGCRLTVRDLEVVGLQQDDQHIITVHM